MAQRRKDNYEPVCREKWLEFKCHEFEYADDKAEIDRMARILGSVFHAEFRKRKEELRRGGMSIKNAYRTTIGEFADRVPTREECKKDGTFKEYERNKRASNRHKDEHDVLVGNTMTRMELHNALADKPSSPKDTEWVAANLYAGVDILSLDPKTVPSQTAVNMLETARDEPSKFWDRHSKEQERKVGARISLLDSGQTHEQLMRTLIAKKRQFEARCLVQAAEERTTDVTCGT